MHFFLSLFSRYRGRLWFWFLVHAGVFALGVLVFWNFHPYAPEIARRVVEKPLYLLEIRDEKSCEGCHQKIDPGMYKQWAESVHFRTNVGCADCHGTDHEAVFSAKGKVSAGTCGKCHEREVADFAESGHATAEDDVVVNARFLLQSPAIQQEGCLVCHSIGARFEDGSVGACNKCHPGHDFSSAMARQPEACEVCHIGPDHPQVEAYRTSVHGILYFSHRDPERAPTCVTCHMPKGAHGKQHNLTLGEIASGAVPDDGLPPSIPMRLMGREQITENRKRMLSACGPCHSQRFARESLERADEIKLEADALVAEGRAILEGLEQDGLLAPMPEDRPAHPIAGHAMVLGGQQTYENTSSIEQAFFRLYKFYHAKTYKSAYHHSPDYLHWKGLVFMKMELDKIRDEARKLRKYRYEALSRVDAQPPKKSTLSR